jgi:hypothetical protein
MDKSILSNLLKAQQLLLPLLLNHELLLLDSLLHL